MSHTLIQTSCEEELLRSQNKVHRISVDGFNNDAGNFLEAVKEYILNPI